MIALTCGKFDILHAGHCALLNYAVTLIERCPNRRLDLIVGVVSDRVYHELERKAPIFSEGERAQQLEEYLLTIKNRVKEAGFRFSVILYNTITAVPLIDEYNPDWFIKGSTSHSIGLMKEKALCMNKGVSVITYQPGMSISSELIKEKTLFYLQEEMEL